jgi:hypothetical protein
MTTFCILCRAEIPEKRQRRGGVTCCAEHGREYRRQRCAERAKRFCRLCGRKARKPRVEGKPLAVGSVDPTDHVIGDHKDRDEDREPLKP